MDSATTSPAAQADSFGARGACPARALTTEQDLAAACVALLDEHTTLSAQEQALAASLADISVDATQIACLRDAIVRGEDPLGEAFVQIRSAADRRATGAVYTPHAVVASMLAWVATQGTPARIVDPGAGSGRFILAAGQAFPDAQLIAVEKDPLAALMLRAALSVRAWTTRASVLIQDYRDVDLPPCCGTTAFIGNPPYVRHHGIDEAWKTWYARRFAEFGIKASALAGLHLHFFLQTRLLATRGDVGAFITSAEWLDVNYGVALRRLLLEQLGGVALHVLEPTIEAFPGTATTAAITCFRVGELEQPMRMRCVDTVATLNGLTLGTAVPRDRLHAERRWSAILRPQAEHADAEIELGEMFRVHRGQVTGANDIWIAGEHSAALPERIKMPAVTRAMDLIHAGAILNSSAELRRVVDLPADLDEFSPSEKRRIGAFLAWARRLGADAGYVARHRKAWWAVGLKAPAPILCTYMARRAPQFTVNVCAARHINIAHGLYPRESFPAEVLTGLVAWLNEHIVTGSGRTYSGGLTKFEPREIERLRIPRAAVLGAPRA